MLPVAGTYTIEIDPDARHTGALKLGLATVPADSTGTIAVGGSSTVTITGAGQNARRTFTGAANARVALTISDNTIAYGYVTIRKPDGTSLWYSSASAGSTRWSDTLVLPVAGTYTIEVDPDAQHTGTLKLGLKTVPADSTGTIAIGGTSTVTITGAGQNARRTFTGTAGQSVELTVSDNTISYGYVTIRKPDGTTLWYSSASAGSVRVSGPLALPVSGGYAIEVDPDGQSTGALRLALAAAAAPGLIAPRTGVDGGPWPPAPEPVRGRDRSAAPSPEREDASRPAAPSPERDGRATPATADRGSRRVSLADSTCRFGYRRLMDPIATGASAHVHAHDFFGRLARSGRPGYRQGRGTTCRGGSTRAAYWTPALFTRGRVVEPARAVASLRAAGRDRRALRPFPRGLKVVAGHAKPSGAHGHGHAMDPGRHRTHTAAWRCSDGRPAASVDGSPRCARGTRLVLNVRFPACWNGKALDSTDHRAHMAYAEGARCPLTHPVAVPELVLRVEYATSGGRAVTLASGAADTAHADLAVSGVELPPPALGARDRGTSLTGQVLRLDRKPLAGATLELGGRRTQTDRTGRFTLTGIPGGHRVLVVDGADAGRPGHRFGRFEAGVDLERGRSNALPYTIWMPERDLRHEIRIPAETTREVVLRTPKVPGLEVRIPKGTTIRDTQGRVVRRLGLTPIPVKRPPFPLPMLGVKVPIYFTVQPGGAYVLPKGARVIYPNYTHEPAGQRVEFWNYDPKRKGWHVYGHGRVTADGRQVVPNRGVRIYRFTGAMFNGGNLPPDAGPPPGGCSQGGDPVDCATGLFLRHDTDLSMSDTLPIDLSRTYRPGDDRQRAFGMGWSMPYDMFLWSRQQYQEVDLILPDGGRVHYERTSPGTSYSDAVFESTSTPTEFYKSTIRWVGGWRLRLKDGTTFDFPSYRPVSAITDRFGNRITITRDGNKITQITSPNGRWISFDHDADGRITEARDNIGRTVTYHYDATGRLVRVVNPLGGETKYAYDTSNRMTAVTNPRGYDTVRNTYDAAGRVAGQTLADGSTYGFAYTTAADGRITATTITDPRGIKRQVTFNANGYALSEVYALGRTTQQRFTFVRGPGNRLTAMTDPLGRRTTRTYDASGNLASVTRLAGTPEANTTTLTHEPTFNLPATLTDALGHRTTLGYDARGALTSFTDPLGRRSTVTSDGSGRPLQVTDATGAAAARFTYQGGDLVEVQDAVGRRSRQWSDPAGRIKYVVDPFGNVSTLAHDALDRVTSQRDAEGGTTAFTYDANGNLTRVRDALGHATAYAYNGRDQQISKTDPLGRRDTLAWDKSGNLIRHTERRGQIDTFTYDPLDRQTGASFGSGDTDSYTYDKGDRLTAVATTQGTRTESLGFSYDGLDRVTSETSPRGTVGVTYDAASRRTGMTATGQPATTYTHDAAGQLTRIARGTTVATFGYDAAGRRTTAGLPNGVSARYSYDASGFMTGLDYARGTTALGSLTYAYDDAGRRTRTDGTFAGTRLPAAVSNATYDAANQLTSWGGTPLTYDANGNIKTDGARSYEWNARGELASVTAGATTTGYTYDALGRRVARRSGSATTGYLYDGANMIQELKGTARTQLLTGEGVDEYLARIDGTSKQTFLVDDIGSTMALVSGTGAISTSYAYEAYGRTTSTGTTNPNTLQYAGRENEGGDLYYNRARYYSPRLHRFISQDPLGLAAADPNVYAYTSNDPLNRIDPNGETWYDPSTWGPTARAIWVALELALNNGKSPTLDSEKKRQQTEERVKKNTPGNKQKKPGSGGGDDDDDDDPSGGSPVGASCPVGEENKGSDTAKAVGAGLAAVGAGYLIYRAVRMIPSLAPPLWPTIPVNLAVP